MQIIENWSDVQATVIDLKESSSLAEFGQAALTVHLAENVPGFANLMVDTVGQRIDVFIPLDLIRQAKVQVNNQIRCRVRKAGPDRYFVHRESLQVL